MIRELYGTSMLKYENKEETLEYYILNNNDEIRAQELNLSEKGNKIGIYGIEIIKRNKFSEEKSFISDLTINKEFAQEIVQKIMDNMVTPIHLYDVLENFIS